MQFERSGLGRVEIPDQQAPVLAAADDAPVPQPRHCADATVVTAELHGFGVGGVGIRTSTRPSPSSLATRP